MASEVEFARLIGGLKQLRRRGWIINGIPSPESDADHMYRMAILSFLGDESLDIPHVIELSLVHDMCEVIAGDVTPLDGVPQNEKHKAEASAMSTIAKMIPTIGTRFEKLWHEFESESTPEAIFVHDLDKFDMYLQANEYERMYNIRLDRFFEKPHVFRTAKVQSWYDTVVAQRNKLQNEGLRTNTSIESIPNQNLE